MYAQFNAKYLYLACVTLFEVGSVLCGAAPSMAALIVGRTICGLGGSGMYTGVLVLLAVCTHDHERAMYNGLVGITWGAGTVLGPIVGGALADNASWRWAFYLNLCVGGLCSPAYIFLLPSKDPRPTASWKKRLQPIDWLGTVLMAGFFASLLMAISFGGIVYAWSSSRIIGLFVVAGILFILFSAQQFWTLGTTRDTRLFPLHFLSSRTMVILFVSVGAAATATFVIIYLLPLYFQIVKNESALASGVRLLPFVCFMVALCVLNGVLLGKFGYYMPWFLSSAVFIVVGSAVMYSVNEHTSTARISGYTILYGIGAGASIQMPFSVAQARAKPEEVALAIGFLTCSQLASPAIALSIGSSVFLNEAMRDLKELLPKESDAAILATVSNAGTGLLSSSDPETNARTTHVIAGALRKAYALPLSVGGLMLVLSLFLKREKLFGAPKKA